MSTSNVSVPIGCVYEGENGKTKYCPMVNHDDVPYCQYLEDDEAAIGIDERPVYCPIVELPSADVQPERKTGKWIKYGVQRCGEQHYKCTSCGYYINFGQWGELYTKEFKYCPNCGARMDGEQNDG